MTDPNVEHILNNLPAWVLITTKQMRTMGQDEVISCILGQPMTGHLTCFETGDHTCCRALWEAWALWPWLCHPETHC